MNSSCQSNILKENMADCTTCYFRKLTGSDISPCKSCLTFSNYTSDSNLFWGETEEAEVEFDVVDKPKHYMLFPEYGIEVRDVIKKLVKKMEDNPDWAHEGTDYADYFQAMQYFMRFMEKNGKEDLKKGVWYINKMIENWEEDDSDDS